MIELNIPGRGPFRLKHLIADVNGTLAVDGILVDGLVRRIANLSDRLEIHLLTADTHGKQSTIDHQLNLTAVHIRSGNESSQKAEYVRKLGANTVVAIGQGANDAEMLKAAALGFCILSQVGVSRTALMTADLIVPDIFVAFDLLNKPLRIVASLQN